MCYNSLDPNGECWTREMGAPIVRVPAMRMLLPVLLLCLAVLASGCAGMRPIMDTTTMPDGTVVETVNVEATIALQQASIANAQTALSMFITAMDAVRELQGDEWSAEDQARYEREQARQERNIELMREAMAALLSRRDGGTNATP